VNLDYSADVVVWSQGVFGLSEGTLATLVQKLPSFDYAVLVLTPDDISISRGNANQTPRDNVLFELGLFMGVLGHERCFIVYDRGQDLKLPSDLAGVTPATYQKHSSGDLIPSLGSASTQIEAAIIKLGVRRKTSEDVYIDATTQYRVIADLLEPASHQFFILMYEQGVLLRREEWMYFGVRQEYSLKEQKGMGHGYFRINELCRKLADAGLLTQDLRGNVSLTERGKAFSEWLINTGLKAEYFWCDYGTWGTRPKEFDKTDHMRSAPQTVIELNKNKEQ